MADITRAVISGSLAALRLVRQYLSNPALIYTPNGDLGLSTALISQTVVMQATRYREVLANQASKMLLVDVSKGKSFLNDNIAPMPRVWEIEGFLFPLAPFIPITDQIQLEALKDTLRQASDSRQLIQFKPVATSIFSQFSQVYDALVGGKITGTIPVVILSIEFEMDSTVQNKAPFRLTLQKIDTLSSATASGSVLSASPDGVLGNPAAAPSSNVLGNTANTPGDTASLP
jgi:hypothetical protein